MKTKQSYKKRLLIIVPLTIIILVLLTVMLVFTGLRANVYVYTNTEEISDLIASLHPRVIEIDSVVVKAQPDGFTCGITTVAIISSFLTIQTMKQMT